MIKGISKLAICLIAIVIVISSLILIKLFSSDGQCCFKVLPRIYDFQQTYNFYKERDRCSSICSTFTVNGCKNLSEAAVFCTERVSIDIDNNGKVGEKGHYGIVAGMPFCEDGLFCFHIYDKCGCGNYTLDVETCKNTTSDYYKSIGMNEKQANEIICNNIQPGICEKDPRLWEIKLPGYKQATIPKNGIGNPSVMGADYWWKAAGYSKICE